MNITKITPHAGTKPADLEEDAEPTIAMETSSHPCHSSNDTLIERYLIP
jgi:hypothetical protein